MSDRSPAVRILEFMAAIADLNADGGPFSDMTPPEVVFALQSLLTQHTAMFQEVIKERYGAKPNDAK